ncbi:MAG: hypothetical protein HY020_18265 [Burkholderiales bacterium]|nr:hypothetical protein [Burkholderiales bacterium]
MRHLAAWTPLAISVLLIAGCASTPAPRPAVSPAAAPAATPAPPAPPAPAARAEAARRSEFDAALSRWHGAPLSELQAKLGKPDAVTRQADGSWVYAYTRAMPAQPGSGTSKFSCTVRYAVDDKTRLVRSHSIEGC